ncbi:MAG: hypothetical protein ACPGUE_09570 [Marinomonas sp.]
MNDLSQLFGGFITEPLAGYKALPESLDCMINQACLSLLDSEILIEDDFSQRLPLSVAKVKQPLPKFEQTFVIDELTKAIKETGFGPHFHQIIGLFGSIMLNLTATEAQQAQVDAWLEKDIFGHFLMTDAGGPSLANWSTELSVSPDETGMHHLKVNKKWGIEAHDLGFVMLVVKQSGKPYPITLMLTPEQSKELKQDKVGSAYLDGALQLGNVVGEVKVSPDQILKKGGMASVNRFLTLVRPRFVKALMHHLLWLDKENRLDMDAELKTNIDFILGFADHFLAQPDFSIHSVDQVLALKFASNELLANLVASNKVKSFADQRDLLGFTKMEGSSYRCFFEIYAKQKRARR